MKVDGLSPSASLILTGLMLSMLSSPGIASQPITGVYRLTTQAQPTMCLDVVNSGNVDGTYVQMTTAAHAANQQWMVEAQGDGTYKIYAFSGENSMQMLDNNAGTYAAVVHTWEDLAVEGITDTNQRWYFDDMGNGYYRIIPQEDGLASSDTLDVGQGDPAGASGETTDIWTYYGGGNQLFKLDWSGPTKILPNPKKGLPCVPSSFSTNANDLHCSWIYDWSYNAPPQVPTGIEFVPMIWGWTGDTNIESEVLAANPGMKHILGFNEPDQPNSNGGSNMTVAEGLTGFQYVSAFESLGIGVGSPACSADTDSWMSSFMAQALTSPYNYNIDFVGYHTYNSDSTPLAAADGMLGYLDAIYSAYGKPIWATEFAPTNLSPADSATYIRLVCQGLNSRSYVQRYSFFTSEPITTSGWGASVLINGDGTFSTCGQIYSRM